MKKSALLFTFITALAVMALLPAQAVKIAEWTGVNSGVTTSSDPDVVAISDLSLIGGAKNTATDGDLWGMNNVHVVGAGMSFTVSTDGSVIENATVDSNVQASNTGPIEMVWKVNGVQVAAITKTKANAETFSSNLGTLEDGDVVTLEYNGSTSVGGGTPGSTGTFRFRPTLELSGTIVPSGPPVLRVNIDEEDGFSVTEGSSATLTATAQNGTTPYSYSWTSSLGASHYTASGNQFTIEDTAPVGSYWVKVEVEDNDAETADKTINFTVKDASAEPDVFIDFESGSLSTAYAEGTSTLEDGMVWAYERTVKGNLAAEKKNGDWSARIAPLNNTNAYLMLTEPYDADIASISFLLASYGTDSMANVVLTVEVSSDGDDWTVVETFEGAADIPSELTEQVIDEIPAGARYVKFFATSQIAGNTKRINIDDIAISFGSSGPAALSVSFVQADNFSVEVGEGATITANVTGGETPYLLYDWTTSLPLTDWAFEENVFTIQPSAAVGSYWAKLEVTDSASDTADKTIHFSITAPAPKYAITVNAGANGSATTSPDTQAAAGVEVTINAEANIGYVVDAITVTAADSSNVPVSNNKFTMPAQAVTVAVSFKEAPAVESAFIDFESGTLPSTYTSTTAFELEDGKDWIPLRLYKGNGATDRKNGDIALRMYPTTATNSSMTLAEPYDADITAISFWVASFSSDTMAGVALNVDVSSDGSTWSTIKTLSAAADIPTDLTEVVVDSGIPAGARYIRFEATAGAASNKRINIDDITVSFGTPGPAVFSVSFDKDEGFTVNEGNSAVITASAKNGSAPYTYSWSSSLGATHYTASANAFTIKDSAPAGSYWAKVEAEDSDEATADKTINFSVVEPGTGPDALITFENGTLSSAYAPNTAALEDGKSWTTERVVKSNAESDKKIDALSARFYPVTGTNAVLTLSSPYTEDVSKVSFWVASYGTDNMANVILLLKASADGSTWTTIKTLTGAADITATLTEVVVDAIPADTRYLQFEASAQAASNKRINIDNIGIWFGSGPSTDPQVLFTGGLTGTVGQEFALDIELIDGVADDWTLAFYDPDDNSIWDYDWDGQTFSFTPEVAGTYTLTATAVDQDWEEIASDTVEIVISEGGGEPEFPITEIVYSAGAMSFDVPPGATFSVFGASEVVNGDWDWEELTLGDDYTVSGNTISILTTGSVPAARMIRIGGVE